MSHHFFFPANPPRSPPSQYHRTKFYPRPPPRSFRLTLAFFSPPIRARPPAVGCFFFFPFPLSAVLRSFPPLFFSFFYLGGQKGFSVFGSFRPIHRKASSPPSAWEREQKAFPPPFAAKNYHGVSLFFFFSFILTFVTPAKFLDLFLNWPHHAAKGLLCFFPPLFFFFFFFFCCPSGPFRFPICLFFKRLFSCPFPPPFFPLAFELVRSFS